MRLAVIPWLVALAVPAGSMAQEEGRQEARDPQPAMPPRLGLHVENALGLFLANSTRWPDGSRASPSCAPLDDACNFSVALGLGMDWLPLRHFGLGLRGRWVHPRSSATILGRHLEVVEVLAVPQLHLPWKWRRFPPAGARSYLAVPIGVAWSFLSRRWTRAVKEDWNGRPGLSTGVALGLEMYWSRRWGTLVELAYQVRFLRATLISTPVDEPQAQVGQQITTTHHQILFSVGLLLGFYR